MKPSGRSKTAHQPVKVIKERGIKQKRTEVMANGLRRKTVSVLAIMKANSSVRQGEATGLLRG